MGKKTYGEEINDMFKKFKIAGKEGQLFEREGLFIADKTSAKRKKRRK